VRTPIERFEEKVERDPETGCWLWAACRNSAGYGKFGIDGRVVLAHRFSYEQHVGPIPDGLQLDHLCRVRCCVNPAHLEPVTGSENVRRGKAGEITKVRHAQKTHCPQGHAYTEDNITPQILSGRWTARCCKTCKRIRALARYHANSEAINLRRAACNITR
jgi:hypothetical protein